MKLDVRDAGGNAVDPIEVDDTVFGIEPNETVVHQALLAQLAARRAGTASTKTRGEVAGSTRKIRRQKGLGMARQGSARAPHRVGGGIVFGPKPRSYEQRLPKRMRRLAIRSVLSARVRDGRLRVISDLAIAEPSTKAVVSLLQVQEAPRGALIVTGDANRTAFLSARNVPGTRVTPASTLSVADMLSHHTLLLTVDAVRRIETLWGGERATSRRVLASSDSAGSGEAS